jgi:hypothetical protein
MYRVTTSQEIIINAPGSYIISKLLYSRCTGFEAIDNYFDDIMINVFSLASSSPTLQENSEREKNVLRFSCTVVCSVFGDKNTQADAGSKAPCEKKKKTIHE